MYFTSTSSHTGVIGLDSTSSYKQLENLRAGGR